jgi:hypothetical protein
VTEIPADARIAARRTARPQLAALALFALSAALLQVALNTSDMPTEAVVWAGLAMASYAFGILCLITGVRGTGGGLTSWRFGAWMMAWCGTTYGLATVTWSHPQTGVATEIAISSVARALSLVATGTTMWALGYFAGPGLRLRSATSRAVSRMHRRFSGDVRGPLTPWLVYAIGTAARVGASATTGRLGYVGNAASAVSTATSYGQIVSLLSLLAPLALAAAALQTFRERLPGAWITMTVLFLAEVAFDVASGQKQNFVVAVLAVAIPYSAARYRLPKLALAILALIFLVIIVPFTQSYRSAARNGSTALTPSQAVSTVPGILQETFTGNGAGVSLLPRSVGYLLQRSRDIDSPAMIMQRTPAQISFGNAADLVVAPLAALVPRALWPSKPILATGYQFGQQYFGLPPTVYSSTTITPIGDLYRHGGWLPVIVGMFFFGCGVRLLDDILDVQANPQSIFLVLLIFPNLVMSEQDWITLMAGIPASIALWLFAVLITFGKHSSRTATAP